MFNVRGSCRCQKLQSPAFPCSVFLLCCHWIPLRTNLFFHRAYVLQLSLSNPLLFDWSPSEVMARSGGGTASFALMIKSQFCVLGPSEWVVKHFLAFKGRNSTGVCWLPCCSCPRSDKSLVAPFPLEDRLLL